MNKSDFADQLSDAYRHLYDLVSLRSHPIIDIVVLDTSVALKERAWRLHNLLLDVIDDLDPGPHLPVGSRPWRRHRLMVLRYRKGLLAEAVAEELGIGQRHYYREHKAAVDALADIIWDRHVAQQTGADTLPSDEGNPESSVGEIELLRLEFARVAQSSRYTRLDRCLGRILPLLDGESGRRAVCLEVDLPPRIPCLSMNESVLRQMLLQALGYLIERSMEATIQVDAHVVDEALWLTIAAVPGGSFATSSPDQAHLGALREMASAAGVHAEPILKGGTVAGFCLRLPIAERSVLAIDDNEDTLHLLRHYLPAQGYPVVTAQTAEEGLDLARTLRPYAILLDLMMPGRDGWDLLQTLLSDPSTGNIPIIVCSVLKQRDLALSLGATGFVAKPFKERDLEVALGALDEP